MAMLHALVLLSTFGNTLAQLISTGSCPPIESQRDFDYEKFHGRWYQVKKLISRVEVGTRCNFRDYTPGEDNNPLKLTETFSYGDVTNIASASRELYAPDENYPAELIGQFPATIPRSPSTFIILETDYDNYAVIYSCTERGPVKSIYAWLEFRDRHPIRSFLKRAYKVLRKNGVDTSKLLTTDQTDCSDAPELISEAF